MKSSITAALLFLGASLFAAPAFASNGDDSGAHAFLLASRDASGSATQSPAAGAAAGKAVSINIGDTEKGYVKKGAALGYVAAARNRYRDMIARYAATHGVPFSLADAIIRIESRYNPSARNGGAVGLMQIKPQTARGLGYSGGAAGLMNPDTNLRYGMLYLAQAYRLSGGNTCATVMRYQSGHYATRINAANMSYCAKARTIMVSN